MSRIGKKPIPLPSGVKYTVQGNTVVVEGPKGKVEQVIPAGIKLETKDGQVHAVRENDSQAAVHGLTRALVFECYRGRDQGLVEGSRHCRHRLSCRAQGQEHGGVHPRLLAPDRVSAADRHHGSDRSRSRRGLPSPASTARRWARSPRTCARCASPIRTRTRACATRTRS